MKKFLRYAIAAVFVWGCQTVPEPAEKSYFISASQNTPAGRAKACSFRYKIENIFDRLNDQSQQVAIRAGFDVWQKANPNILFLQKQDALTAEILIRFEEHAQIEAGTKKSPYGLVRGTIATLSAIREENGVYTILLDSDIDWDLNSLSRVIAYHIGIFLGLDESPENGSMVNPVYVKESIKLSRNDSLLALSLYATPCTGQCNNFLPMSLNLLPQVTKSIRIDKPGKIRITGSGSMIVGKILGWSTPVGLEKGLFSFPIGDFSLERSMNHAALMYKIGSEENWRLCGAACEFETDGVSQCLDITLGINDNNLTDNSGAYQIVVDYKK